MQPSLSEQCVYHGEASTCEDLCVWLFVVPVDVEDAVEAAHVESVQPLLLLCIYVAIIVTHYEKVVITVRGAQNSWKNIDPYSIPNCYDIYFQQAH